MLSWALPQVSATGVLPQRSGSGFDHVAPYGVFEASDDFVYVVAHSGAKVLCVHSDYLDAIDRVRMHLLQVEHFVALEGRRAGWLDYEGLIEATNVNISAVSNGTFNGSGDYLVRLNPATSATVSRLLIDQVDVSGFGSGGMVSANPDTGQTHAFPAVLMTSCTVNDMAWICDIGAETGGSTVTTDLQLSTVTTTNMTGNAYIRDTGVVTFELYKVQLSGTNWDVLPGGKLTVVQQSIPPAGSPGKHQGTR